MNEVIDTIFVERMNSTSELAYIVKQFKIQVNISVFVFNAEAYNNKFMVT